MRRAVPACKQGSQQKIPTGPVLLHSIRRMCIIQLVENPPPVARHLIINLIPALILPAKRPIAQPVDFILPQAQHLHRPYPQSHDSHCCRRPRVLQ